MVSKYPHSLEIQHTLYQVPQWKDLQPHFCTESLSEGRDLGPSIYQCCCFHFSITALASLAWPNRHTKDQGCDTQILPPVSWYLLTSLSSLHFAAYLGNRCEVPTTSPQFPFKGYLGTHELNVPNLTSKTFNPFAVTSLIIVSIFTLTSGIMLICITILPTS